jgi:Spy/CpxP family protein refolding chaperone
MKRWTKTALIAGVLAASVASLAWGGRAAARHFGKYAIAAHIEETLDYIDATPQQRQLVNQVKEDIFAKMKAKRQDHAALRDQVAKLLAADQLDVHQLRVLADQKSNELRSTAYDVIDDIAKVHASLTPDQRQKLYARYQEMSARRKARQGRRDAGQPQE